MSWKNVLIDQISESRLHLVMQGLVVGLDLRLAVLFRVLELHGGQLVQDVAHCLANNGPETRSENRDRLNPSIGVKSMYIVGILMPN